MDYDASQDTIDTTDSSDATDFEDIPEVIDLPEMSSDLELIEPPEVPETSTFEDVSVSGDTTDIQTNAQSLESPTTLKPPEVPPSQPVPTPGGKGSPQLDTPEIKKPKPPEGWTPGGTEAKGQSTHCW